MSASSSIEKNKNPFTKVEAKNMVLALLNFHPQFEEQNVKKKYFQFSKEDLIRLCQTAKSIFQSESVLLNLEIKENESVTVVGDLHGQYHDFLRILHFQKMDKKKKYLFLGDIVDRGDWSIECIVLLFSLKIWQPDLFYVIRGNHECPMINKVYGFYNECYDRFQEKTLWAVFNDVFQWLPLCAVIENRIFCTHGGIPKDLNTLDELRNINRQDLLTIPDDGIICDLVWSDPDNENMCGEEGFRESDRGCSFVFSDAVAKNFCEKHNFDFICRAHQVVDHGYEFFGKDNTFVTVFSASNYCYDQGNKGAILNINSDLECNFTTFDSYDPQDLLKIPPFTPKQNYENYFNSKFKENKLFFPVHEIPTTPKPIQRRCPSPSPYQRKRVSSNNNIKKINNRSQSAPLKTRTIPDVQKLETRLPLASTKPTFRANQVPTELLSSLSGKPSLPSPPPPPQPSSQPEIKVIRIPKH